MISRFPGLCRWSGFAVRFGSVTGGPHDGGGLARRRSTAFRDGWTASRRASRNPAASQNPQNAVSPWEAGAPRSAASRWEAAPNPWLCDRTVLAYWKFESISLQRRVHCELYSWIARAEDDPGPGSLTSSDGCHGVTRYQLVPYRAMGNQLETLVGQK
jgi:hypothetical protein